MVNETFPPHAEGVLKETAGSQTAAGFFSACAVSKPAQIGAGLAARVIAFRSAVPSGHARMAAGLTAQPAALSQRTPFYPKKVLSMSKQSRHRQVQSHLHKAQATLAQVESELVNDYVEVELTGISFVRLACIYYAGFREAKSRMTDGVRSLFRLTPAH